MASSHQWLFKEFIEENEYNLNEDDSLVYEENLEYIEVNEFENHDQFSENLLVKFLKWCDNNIENEYDLPTWLYLTSPKLIKKQWLIHLSDEAENISNNGFIYGVDDVRNLGLTYRNSNNKSSNGYNFAYTISDFERYGQHGEHGQHGFNYGDSVVLFKASGIRAWHNGDEEYQTIFKGDMTEDLIYLDYDSNNDKWFISSIITGNPIVKKDSISEIIKWLDINYQQYYKHIFNKSNFIKKGGLL